MSREPKRRQSQGVAQPALKLRDHLNELRGRLAWIVVAIVIFSVLAYMKAPELTKILQAPIHQKLYYTTPGGGFTFILRLAVLTGITAALPVIVYHAFSFVAPLIKNRKRGFVALYTTWSFILAYSGAVFAYFLTLPAALHFLVQFGGGDIQALIGANDYFNFVLAYEVGFAVLFQIPLIVLFIDKLTPLSPKKMMKAQRFLIAGSFVISAMITPTPDPMNQVFMAAPIILLYQISILPIWHKTRGKRKKQSIKLKGQEAYQAKQQRTAVAAPELMVAAAKIAAGPSIAAPVPPKPAVIKQAHKAPAPVTYVQRARPAATTPRPRPHLTQTEAAPRPRPRQYMDFVPSPSFE